MHGLDIAIVVLIALGLVASICVVALACVGRRGPSAKAGMVVSVAFEALALVLALLSHQATSAANGEMSEKLDFISGGVARVVDYVDARPVDSPLAADDERLKELAYGDHSPIVFKDDVFWVGIEVRKEGEKPWSSEVDAAVGDVVEFQISYVNKTDEVKADAMARAVLPNNLEYVPGSTVVYNESHQAGMGILDDTVSTTGVNIGSYRPGGNAYVRFSCRVRDASLAGGLNQLVTWGTVTLDRVVLSDSADVYVRAP